MFENECFLLLGTIYPDESNASAFLESYAIRSIASKDEVDKCFEECLGNSYVECCEVIQDIEDSLRDLQFDLQSFVRSEARQGNRAKETVRRVRDAVEITFEKNDYLKKIKRLNDLRLEFAALRNQIEEMCRRSNSLSRPNGTSSKTIPTKFGLIREASSTLHESLTRAWESSCDEAAHTQHTTILCLDTNFDDSVRLDLAISSTISDELFEER